MVLLLFFMFFVAMYTWFDYTWLVVYVVTSYIFSSFVIYSEIIQFGFGRITLCSSSYLTTYDWVEYQNFPKL